MPIPFAAPHNTISSSLSHGAAALNSNTSNSTTDTSAIDNSSSNSMAPHGSFESASPPVRSLGLSTHSRIQTQTLDNRRWNRLQRRLPFDSHAAIHHHHHHHHHHHSHNHYSPRTRYFTPLTPTSPPSNRASRLLLSPPLLPSQFENSQSFSPSSPPHVRDHNLSANQQTQYHQQPNRLSSQGVLLSPFPSAQSSSSASLLSPNAHPTAVSNLRLEQTTHRSSQESSRSSESFNSPSAPDTSAHTAMAPGIEHVDNSPQEADSSVQPSHPALSSTPMERSLTNNPVITPSHSNIRAASIDPSSVSVSVSVSASSSMSATSRSSLSSSNRINRNNVTSSTRTSNSSDNSVTGSLTNLISNNLSQNRHQNDSAQQRMTVSSSDIDSRDNMGQSTRLEVDEGIQFRHLNRVYFSPSTQQPRHDDDLGMDSPPQPQSRSNLQYIDIHDASFSDQEDEYMHNIDSMEDIDFGDSNQRHSMYDDQGDEFATITIRRRPDLIVEEEEGEHEAIRQHRNHQQNAYRSDDGDDDEEDDGIDLVMEGHRNFTGVIRSPSSSPLSHIERPRHAQLSPRSAAALTNIFTMDRSSWSQPMISSSITAGLIAMAQPGTQSEYDNNPYYRRPSVSFFERANNTIQTNTPTPSNSNHSSLSSHPQWQLSTDPGNAFIPRSMLTPHGSLNLTATNSYQQYERIPSADGRSCGEANCIASMEAQGDVWPLKFDMYYADGGEFNAAHSVENVLKNDSSVYCSRRSTNINICLKLSQPHLSFVLTQFRAKAPTTGFTAPCKEGLIFISHEPIQLEKTKYFDNITRQMYDEYMNAMEHQTGFDQMYKIHGSNADAIVPAAFFQLGGPDETCTINFTPNRSGRYVLIKLLRSRCTNALQRPENIDLQYLGLFGYTGARSFASGGLL